jgi:hypothetical protein
LTSQTHNQFSLVFQNFSIANFLSRNWCLSRLAFVLILGFQISAVAQTQSGLSNVKTIRDSSSETVVNHSAPSQGAVLIQLGTPPSNNSPIPISRLFWFVGKIALVVVGGLVGFILILNLLGYLFRKATDLTSGSSQKKILTILFVGVFGLVFLLPRSQSLVVKSWNQQINGITEASFFGERLFGEPQNKYRIDPQGTLVELKLRSHNVKDISELKGLFDLTSLRKLEIAGQQFAGTIDFSTFTELEEIKLHNTGITSVTGLQHLRNLKTVDLEGSSVETLDDLGATKGLVLSRTRITDLSKLSAPSLETLSIEGTDLATISGFESLSGIKLLLLRYSRNVDLDRIADMPGLAAVALDHTDVRDLSPLRRCQSLQLISFVDTKVSDLSGLNGLHLLFVGTDNPIIKSEDLRQQFGAAVIRARADVIVHSWLPEKAKSIAKRVDAVLLFVLLLCVVPLPYRWQNRYLTKLRRVILLMIPGAFGVLVLWFLSKIDVPFGDQPRGPFFVFLEQLAWLFAGVWLLLFPALLLARDSRIIKRRLWSVPCFFLSRRLPFIALVGTVLAVVGYAISASSWRGGAGAVILFLVGVLCCLWALLLSLVLFGGFMARRDMSGMQLSRSVKMLFLIPIGMIVLLVCAGGNIFINLDKLADDASSTIFLYFLAIPTLVALSQLIGLVIDTVRWQRDRRKLQAIFSGASTGTGSIVEVSLRQGVVMRRPIAVVFRLLTGAIFSFVKDLVSESEQSSSGEEPDVATAQNPAQLHKLTVTPDALHTLKGLIVIMQQRDLEHAGDWELQEIGRLLREVYTNTYAPIWLTGDSFGHLAQENESLKKKFEVIQSFTPFVSAVESFSAPDNTVYDSHPPETIVDCIRANGLVSDEVLTEYRLGFVLNQAFTPVAIVLRSVFGQASIPDRLDALVKAVEIAVATFVLLAIADHKSKHRDASIEENRRIDRIIDSTFSSGLTFKDWTGLFDLFCKKKSTSLTTDLADQMATGVQLHAGLLREMVAVIGGTPAMNQVAPNITSRRQLLPLLNAFRNVVTAHGSISQVENSELYVSLLLTVLDFLSALPWDRVSIQVSDGNGAATVYRGCVPYEQYTQDRFGAGTCHATYAAASIVAPKCRQTTTTFDISEYFRPLPGSKHIAFYTGDGVFLEPVFGALTTQSASVAA